MRWGAQLVQGVAPRANWSRTSLWKDFVPHPSGVEAWAMGFVLFLNGFWGPRLHVSVSAMIQWCCQVLVRAIHEVSYGDHLGHCSPVLCPPACICLLDCLLDPLVWLYLLLRRWAGVLLLCIWICSFCLICDFSSWRSFQEKSGG